MEPESKVLGATFDALDSVDSDQGPNLMHLMHLKWPQDFRLRHRPPPIQVPLTPNESNASDISHAPEVLALGPTVLRLSRVIRLRPRSAADASTLSKVLALGPNFQFIRSIRFGPGSYSNASNQSKSLGLGRRLSIHSVH